CVSARPIRRRPNGTCGESVPRPSHLACASYRIFRHNHQYQFVKVVFSPCLRRVMPMRRTGCLFAAVSVCFASPSAFGHELWFQPNQQDVASVRLTFGDTPASEEAERVAEIARTKVWADGRPLVVTRLPDGLEAKLPARHPAVLSAFADRGIVDYMGDSFVIFLVAYAQSKPARSEDIRHLGLGDDQVRFLLISREGGPPVVQTVWKGKPVADAVVEVFHVRGEKPAEVRTDSQGEILCP